MPYYREHPLNIDIDRLGKCYFDVKSKLGLKTDDKSLIDFNAICVNRIPGDENSVTGGNIRGLYWTMPDTTNHEEQRLEPVKESFYTEICPEFKGTYVEEMPNPKTGTVTDNVSDAIKNAKSGQVRFRTDKSGIIHGCIGKVSFDDGKVGKNLTALVDELKRLKPASAKGEYIKGISISSTMGPGLKLNISELA